FFMATPRAAAGRHGLLRIHTFDNAGPDYRRDDLFREKSGTTVHERLPFNLERGETVSFGVLRQSLFLAPYSDFCALNNVYLTIRLRGKASFTVYVSTPGGEVPRLVADRIVSGSGQEEDIFICRLSDLPPNSRLFWSAVCVSEVLTVEEVSF